MYGSTGSHRPHSMYDQQTPHSPRNYSAMTGVHYFLVVVATGPEIDLLCLRLQMLLFLLAVMAENHPSVSRARMKVVYLVHV